MEEKVDLKGLIPTARDQAAGKLPFADGDWFLPGCVVPDIEFALLSKGHLFLNARVSSTGLVAFNYKNPSNYLTVKARENFFDFLLYRWWATGVEISDRQREIPNGYGILISLRRQLWHDSLQFQALLLEAETIHPNKTRR